MPRLDCPSVSAETQKPEAPEPTSPVRTLTESLNELSLHRNPKA